MNRYAQSITQLSLLMLLVAMCACTWVGRDGAAIAPGEVFKDCPDCPEMVTIPGKSYALGKYEVTQKEWRAVMGSNPSSFQSCGDTCPVERVSWNDVQEYLAKLNSKTGKQYRLPTEAEWEYACHGGRQAKYCGGNDLDAVAWYKNNSNKQTHPVGQKQANDYGLYDMSGNVSEWVENKYDDEHGWRTLRGGSWYFTQQNMLAENRSGYEPAIRNNLNGFRLAKGDPAVIAQ